MERGGDPIAEGLEALRRGDLGSARNAFEQAVRAGSRPPWLALADASRRAGDQAGEETALIRQLEAEPRNLPALLRRGEIAAHLRDARGASAFFRAALNQAAAHPDVPPGLIPALRQAQDYVIREGRRETAEFTARLKALHLAPLPRITQALDILTGAKPIYLQQPSMFYFPGLPQRAFYEREAFDWLPGIEAMTPALVSELEAWLGTGTDFAPYVTGAPDRPPPANHLFRDPSWGAHYFWRDGAPVAEHAAACPATMQALAKAPMPVIAGRSPMALWSALRPGTHIAPHHGLLNTRLICHLPLLTPPGCALRVGAETREWHRGEALIFDDSIEHEAWNRGTELRVVLLFEIWRPEIGPEERAELTRLFEAIDIAPEEPA